MTLLRANILFVAANLLHTADHFRQGLEGLTWEINVAGTAVTLGAIATLWLAAREHPQAPVWAAVLGLWSAGGIAASHIAPHWSALSDSYPQIGADAASWVVVLVEIAAALALGITGARALRRTRTPASP